MSRVSKLELLDVNYHKPVSPLQFIHSLHINNLRNFMGYSVAKYPVNELLLIQEYRLRPHEYS